MRVLITGDSHAEWSQFGVQLERRLREAGDQVVRLAIGGSSARSWTRGEPVCRTIDGERRCLTVGDLTAQGPYDVAIVSLGTNDAANAHAAGQEPRAAARLTADRLRQLVTQIGARETWIVGPPRMSGTNAHYTDETMAPVAEALAEAFGARFIDSREVPKLDGDSVHVGPRGGAAWSALVFDRVHSTGARSTRPAPSGAGVPMVAVAAAAVLVFFLAARS